MIEAKIQNRFFKKSCITFFFNELKRLKVFKCCSNETILKIISYVLLILVLVSVHALLRGPPRDHLG